MMVYIHAKLNKHVQNGPQKRYKWGLLDSTWTFFLTKQGVSGKVELGQRIGFNMDVITYSMDVITYSLKIWDFG